MAGHETLLLASAGASSLNNIVARDMPHARARLLRSKGTIRMTFNSGIILTVATVVCATCTPPAKADSLPTIDIQKRCTIRAKATAEMMADKSTTVAFDSCMKSEQEARSALVAAWGDIPASYKAFCIAPNTHSPSYVEWISCLEMNIEVKRLRTKN